MEVWIAIIWKPINVKNMGIEKKVTTKNSIEKVIEAVDKFALFRDCANPGVFESFQNSRTEKNKTFKLELISKQLQLLSAQFLATKFYHTPGTPS